MDLCTYSGFGWKVMTNLRKQEDDGDIQPEIHGLVGKVSNNSLNDMIVKSLNDFQGFARKRRTSFNICSKDA